MWFFYTFLIALFFLRPLLDLSSCRRSSSDRISLARCTSCRGQSTRSWKAYPIDPTSAWPKESAATGGASSVALKRGWFPKHPMSFPWLARWRNVRLTNSFVFFLSSLSPRPPCRTINMLARNRLLLYLSQCVRRRGVADDAANVLLLRRPEARDSEGFGAPVSAAELISVRSHLIPRKLDSCGADVSGDERRHSPTMFWERTCYWSTFREGGQDGNELPEVVRRPVVSG